MKDKETVNIPVWVGVGAIAIGGLRRTIPDCIASDPAPMMKPRLHHLRERHVRQERQGEERPVETREVR
jgi:hypothetical protein